MQPKASSHMQWKGLKMKRYRSRALYGCCVGIRTLLRVCLQQNTESASCSLRRTGRCCTICQQGCSLAALHCEGPPLLTEKTTDSGRGGQLCTFIYYSVCTPLFFFLELTSQDNLFIAGVPDLLGLVGTVCILTHHGGLLQEMAPIPK